MADAKSGDAGAEKPQAKAPTTLGKQRGGCLSAWLVLGMIGGIYSIYIYSRGSALLGSVLPSWGMPVYLVLSVLVLASIYGIWMWKKWGLYGYFGLIAVGLILNIIAGLGLVSSIIGAAVSAGIMYILVKPVMNEFD